MFNFNDVTIQLDVETIQDLLQSNHNRAAQISIAVLEGLKTEKKLHDLMIFSYIIMKKAEQTLSPEKLKQFESYFN